MYRHLIPLFNLETFRFPLKLKEKADTNYGISLPGKKPAITDKKYRYL